MIKINKNIKYLNRRTNNDYGNAVRLGIKKSKGKFILFMDADFSHDPNELDSFVKNLSSNSFVLGSRYVYGGKCFMKGSRLIISYFGNKFIKLVSGIKSNEFTTSYRGFNLDKLENFHMNNVNYKGYSFFMGTIFELNKINVTIKEIPIVFKDRSKGVSKIPRFEILRTLKNLLFFYFKKNF